MSNRLWYTFFVFSLSAFTFGIINIACEKDRPPAETAQPETQEVVDEVQKEEVKAEEREEKPKGYIGTVARAPRTTQERLAIINLENQLKQYRAVHGEWPESLEELEEWGEIPSLPQGKAFDYNAETGEVLIKDN